MSTQAIGGIVGVAGAVVAALGLLLTWYRHEKKPPRRRGRPPRPLPWNRRIFTRTGVALGAGLAICAAGATGIALIILAPSAGPAGPGGPGPTRPINELQYRSQVTRLCLDSDEEARRIEQSNPQATVLGANIDVEKRLVDKIRQIAPPASLKSGHDDLLATWDQRIALLESVYQQLSQAGGDVDQALAKAGELAVKITDLSQTLGVPECGF